MYFPTTLICEQRVAILKHRLTKWIDLQLSGLTHWGRVTHICVGKLTTIGSDNGLSPGRRQAIIWTNAGILLIRTLGTNFSEILCEIHSFSFSKMHLKMSSATWRLFGLGLNELRNAEFLGAVYEGSLMLKLGVWICKRENSFPPKSMSSLNTLRPMTHICVGKWGYAWLS